MPSRSSVSAEGLRRCGAALAGEGCAATCRGRATDAGHRGGLCLEARDALLKFWLEAVELLGPLVVDKRLTVIAGLLLEPAQGRVGPPIAIVDRQASVKYVSAARESPYSSYSRANSTRASEFCGFTVAQLRRRVNASGVRLVSVSRTARPR
jgi:hypothetical protein